MARELKVIKAEADVKISPQGGQIPLPSLHFVTKKHTWSSYDFCKDVGNQLLGVDSKQIPGEMPGKASGDFPQVVSDPDVNRTMNLV